MNAANERAASTAAVDEPQEGSSLYYSLLWTPIESRRCFLATLFLIDALATTLDDVQDAGVAEQKVHWWHEELERLTLGSARHPRVRSCAGSPTASAYAQARLLEILSTSANTRFEPARSDAEHDARLVRDYRARLALLANALESTSALDDTVGPNATWLDDIARGLGLRDQLARLPARLHRGQSVFSEARYARHGLTPSRLAARVRRVPPDSLEQNGNETAGITDLHRALYTEIVDEAHAALQRALSDPAYRATFRQPKLAPLARLLALRACELRHWQKTRPDLLRERTTPTPLVKFYIAWRHRHGAR